MPLSTTERNAILNDVSQGNTIIFSASGMHYGQISSVEELNMVLARLFIDTLRDASIIYELSKLYETSRKMYDAQYPEASLSAKEWNALPKFLQVYFSSHSRLKKRVDAYGEVVMRELIYRLYKKDYSTINEMDALESGKEVHLAIEMWLRGSELLDGFKVISISESQKYPDSDFVWDSMTLPTKHHPLLSVEMESDTPYILALGLGNESEWYLCNSMEEVADACYEVICKIENLFNERDDSLATNELNGILSLSDDEIEKLPPSIRQFVDSKQIMIATKLKRKKHNDAFTEKMGNIITQLQSDRTLARSKIRVGKDLVFLTVYLVEYFNYIHAITRLNLSKLETPTQETLFNNR